MTLSTLQAKSFFFDRMLPVRLFYTRHSEAADWHTHEFSEIAIILNGSAIHETDFCSSSTTVQAGDVLVMPSGGMHKFRNEVDIEQFNVLFQFEKLPVPSKDIMLHPGFSSLFRLNPEYCRKMRYYPKFQLDKQYALPRVRSLLENAYAMQERKVPGYMLAVYGAFLQLIPILLENYHHSNQSLSSRPESPERLADCLDYMQHNFQKELSTGQLAARSGMAPASFVRHFKAATGLTPQEYLIRLRLDEAKQLLQESSCPIAEIAQKTGFADSNYFSRLFKLKNNLSPREYRASCNSLD